MAADLHFDRPAYLGLDRDPAFQALVVEGIRRYGTHFAGSRRAPYCPPIYGALEGLLAEQLGTEAAVLVSSGSLAAALTVEALTSIGETVEAHPTLHAAWRWPIAAAARRMNGPAETVARRRAIVVSGVDPIEVTALPAEALAAVAKTCRLVIDASHQIGLDLFTSDHTALLAGGALVVASLGKTYSVPGAVVAGPAAVVAALRGLASFGGASSAPPAYAYALVEGQGLIAAAQARLRNLNAMVLAAAAGQQGLRTLPGLPVLRVDDAAWVERLRAAGVVMSELVYPAAGGEVVRRVVWGAGRSVLWAEEILLSALGPPGREG